jgi:SWI/SNF-related matrix-associated actin-dependent regulator of chromatin subfamily A3
LKIYGAADKRNQIEPLLNWATPAKHKASASKAGGRSYEAAASYASYTAPELSGYDSSGYGRQMPSTSQTAEALRKRQEEFDRAAELRDMLSTLERVNDEGRRSSLLDTLCSTEDILNLPEHPSPPSIESGELRVDLLRHQV